MSFRFLLLLFILLNKAVTTGIHWVMFILRLYCLQYLLWISDHFYFQINIIMNNIIHQYTFHCHGYASVNEKKHIFY